MITPGTWRARSHKATLNYAPSCSLCTIRVFYWGGSVAKSCLTLCDPMNYSSPGFLVIQYLPELAQTHASSWWCHPTFSSSVASFSLCPPSFPSSGSFPKSWLFAISWPKYWSFSFSISSFNEYSGLISFRIDWFNLLAVQGTLKSPLRHHSWKTSILWHLTFFMVQLSHPYVTTGKTVWIFVGKVMSLLFNILSRFVIAFLPRSKYLSILWSKYL